MKFRISAKALEDIDAIWLYTLENWSQHQADHYYRLIFQEIEYIAGDFEAGKDIGHIRTGYRQSRVKSHLVIYRKGEDGVVEIIRVLHQMMHIPGHL